MHNAQLASIVRPSLVAARGRWLMSVFAITATLGFASRAIAQTAGDCAAVKRRAVGRCVSGNLTCHALAAKKQKPVDPLCLARVEAKLLIAFARAERGDCLTVGDVDAMRAGCDGLVAAMVAALPDTGPTPLPTATGTATSPPTMTATPVPPTATFTPTNSPTRSATSTASATVTPTAPPTGTDTPTPTESAIPTKKETPTETPTATETPTNTETPTETETPTATETPTPSDTPTATFTLRPAPKIVFVTSTRVAGDFGGLARADDFCTALGTAAGLTGRFAAWLSDDVTSAEARLVHATVPYLLIGGTVVANDWADLTDGTLAHAIDLTEGGSVLRPEEQVWTNTHADGSAAASSCSDWTKAPSLLDGGAGTVGATDFEWTEVGTATCDQALHLYCIEQ